jgi:hypothetical protein
MRGNNGTPYCRKARYRTLNSERAARTVPGGPGKPRHHLGRVRSIVGVYPGHHLAVDLCGSGTVFRPLRS